MDAAGRRALSSRRPGRVARPTNRKAPTRNSSAAYARATRPRRACSSSATCRRCARRRARGFRRRCAGGSRSPTSSRRRGSRRTSTSASSRTAATGRSRSGSRRSSGTSSSTRSAATRARASATRGASSAWPPTRAVADTGQPSPSAEVVSIERSAALRAAIDDLPSDQADRPAMDPSGGPDPGRGGRAHGTVGRRGAEALRARARAARRPARRRTGHDLVTDEERAAEIAADCRERRERGEGSIPTRSCARTRTSPFCCVARSRRCVASTRRFRDVAARDVARRQDARPVPTRRRARRGRDGDRLPRDGRTSGERPGRRRDAEPTSRRQGAPPAPARRGRTSSSASCARPRSDGASATRTSCGRSTPAQATRRRRAPALRRRWSTSRGRRCARCSPSSAASPRSSAATSGARSRRRSPRSTRPASSTATSSPRTSSSRPTTSSR